jgi:hypothetical protein
VNPRKARPRARVTLGASRLPVGTVIRVVLFAALAIGGAMWGLHRHMTQTPAPLRVPVPAPAPTFDADAGELPVPEVVP